MFWVQLGVFAFGLYGFLNVKKDKKDYQKKLKRSFSDPSFAGAYYGDYIMMTIAILFFLYDIYSLITYTW